MPSVRKRLETLERSQSERGGTSKDQIVRRVLEGISDAELDLLGSAAYALAQGREWTPGESAAAMIAWSVRSRACDDSPNNVSISINGMESSMVGSRGF